MGKIYIPPTVAVATGKTREEAVANALGLVRENILAKIRGGVLIKPNFLSSVNPLASTQAGAVRPLLAMLRDAGIKTITIAEGGARSTSQAFDTFGYRELADEYGVACVDLNRDTYSRSFEIVTTDQGTHIAEYADRAAEADTIISVPVAKTHDTASVTLSLKNMMGCLRRVHRPRMHGIKIGDTPSRLGERLWNAVEGYPFVIKSFSGVVFTIVKRLRSRVKGTQTSVSPGIVRQVAAMSENLCRLGEVLMPDIAVIDAFEAMEGDGPGDSGTPISMRIAVAGTEPVSCDAVMAYMMGFDPMSIGYLNLLHERGLGVVRLDEIKCIGDDPSRLVHHLKPHYNHPAHVRWRDAWKV